MTERPTCPTHGPLAGLYVCYIDDCGWDARDVDDGLRADDEQSTKPACEVSPDPTEPRVVVLPWDCLASSNKRTSVTDPRRKEYADALARARGKVAVQVQAQGWEPFTGPVVVLVEYHPPDRRRRDCSNLDKLCHDSLEGPDDLPGVYEDDAQVVRWSGARLPPDPDDPRCVIEIRPFEQREARSA